MQTSIRAMYMRGGTSKGVFFLAEDLPADPVIRERTLLRIVGSPDPYRQHIDGMGGATSSTSKVVIVSASQREDCDVDYLFGQVSIDQPMIDWSGNCGNLTAAVGPFAIHRALVKTPSQGIVTVRVWQVNIQKKILVHVPVSQSQVVETGTFELDGVAHPSAEIAIEFMSPGADGEAGSGTGMFPTGNRIDSLDIPGLGSIDATLIMAGNPAVFVRADALGLIGTELQSEVNQNTALLERLETIRAFAAVRMGLGDTPQDVSKNRQHTPKIAFFSTPKDYTASDGKPVQANRIDLLARIVSMGRLHHAMTGTGAVGVAVAAALPGTIVSQILGQPKEDITFGHPSGVLRIGAVLQKDGTDIEVQAVKVSRSARRLMDGQVFVPEGFISSVI